jgi:hypothetical protein
VSISDIIHEMAVASTYVGSTHRPLSGEECGLLVAHVRRLELGTMPDGAQLRRSMQSLLDELSQVKLARAVSDQTRDEALRAHCEDQKEWARAKAELVQLNEELARVAKARHEEYTALLLNPATEMNPAPAIDPLRAQVAAIVMSGYTYRGWHYNDSVVETVAAADALMAELRKAAK